MSDDEFSYFRALKAMQEKQAKRRLVDDLIEEINEEITFVKELREISPKLFIEKTNRG